MATAAVGDLVEHVAEGAQGPHPARQFPGDLCHGHVPRPEETKELINEVRADGLERVAAALLLRALRLRSQIKV